MNESHTLRGKQNPGGLRRRPSSLAFGLLALVALAVAACGPATPAPVVSTQAAGVASSQPTAPAATQPAVVTQDTPPAPATATSAPTAAATLAPTAAVPTSLPTAGSSATAAAPATAGAAPTVAAGEAEVELEDFQFQPKVLTVKAGTRVKFANKDDVVHTATSDTNVFDSGSLAKGDEFFFTFSEPGEYPYYCLPHGAPGGVGMAGTIIVVP